MLVQSLDGKWELREVGSTDALPAVVPGCVHLDLMSAGVIEDPFCGDNEARASWVHESDWEYSRTFTVDRALLERDFVCLECEGLDTIARITVNDTLVAETENMHMAYRFDVKSLLRPGENKIAVSFTSPSEYVKPFIAKDPMRDADDCVQGSFYMRKSPSQWGWDWAPKLPTIGIWKSIRLAGYSGARVDDLSVRQKHRDGKVTLDIGVALQMYADCECRVVLTLSHPDGHEQVFDLKPVGSTAACSAEIDAPQLWWPNGYGSQPLYGVKAEAVCAGEPVHSFSRRVGLRTIELEQRDDEFGTSFAFVVNAVTVFAKGANWVPADQFPARLTEDRYRYLISCAAKANMNMLRAWGGGFYENEVFYDLCDEYGILVWQDFMFACRLYPTDPRFLDLVEEEARQVVTRLRNRACLALWCGNNEIESFLYEWWVDERVDERRAQHNLIFDDLLRRVVSETAPDAFYWRSSPNSGGEPFDKPDDPTRGDGHNWGVWHRKLPFTDYREQFHRFVSEFGMQSFPSYQTCRAYAPEDELNATSYTMELHQKNAGGNGVILHYLMETFRFPKSFEMMCYASQLLQAEAMRYGVEHWRRNRHRCMGALYWQFNDVWPCQSWSGIDYYGRWKALHYFARRFYSPVLLSVREEDTSAEIHVTNDKLEPVDVEIRWSLEKLDGAPIRQGTQRLRAPAEQNTLAASLDFANELAGDMRREAVLVTELVVDGIRGGFTLTPFVPSKHLRLPNASIGLVTGRDEAGAFVEVSTDLAARYVCLEAPGVDCIFSDNYFDLPARRKALVRVESDIDADALVSLRAYSLRDSY